MRSCITDLVKKAFAVMLSLALVVGLLPANVFAENSIIEPEGINVRFTDINGDVISAASVEVKISLEKTVEENTVKEDLKVYDAADKNTDENGSVFLEFDEQFNLADYQEEISMGKVSLEYALAKAGFKQTEGSQIITDAQKDIEITSLELIPVETVNVTIETEGQGKLTTTPVADTNGLVVVEKGSDVEVIVEADAGYVAESVKIGDADANLQENEGKISFNLENIQGDTVVSADFVEAATATVGDFTFNSGEALRFDVDSNTYVYANDKSAQFSTSKEAIRLLDAEGNVIGEARNPQSVSVIDSKEIGQIQLYYKADSDLTGAWHIVDGVSEKETINIVIDKTPSKITLTPDREANQYGYYNDDVTFSVSVEDDVNLDELCSGIEVVSYAIEAEGIETEQGELYPNPSSMGMFSQHTEKWEGKLVVDAELYNTDGVRVTVNVLDKAGNVREATQELKINSTAPKVAVDIAQTPVDSVNRYYNDEEVTATVTIADRASTFDAALATINITAEDKEGQPVAGAYEITWQPETQEKPDEHKAIVTFKENAVYELNVNYTNKAGVTGVIGDSQEIEFEDSFTLDNTAPTGKIGDGKSLWEKLLEAITFGHWINESVTVEVSETQDNLTGVKEILYYKPEAAQLLTVNDLNALYNDEQTRSKFTAEAYEVNNTDADDEDFKFVVYARVEDKAGNVKYISTDGIGFDDTAPSVDFTMPAYDANDYYNKDVLVTVDVKDSDDENGVFSAISQVAYQIKKDGVVTQESDANWGDTADNLRTWQGQISVDSVLNNSDDVEIVVTAVDKAGNVKKTTQSLKINSAAPTVAVAMEPGHSSYGQPGYYNVDRTATITITDRASTFNENVATAGIKIEAKDAADADITLVKGTDFTVSEWVHNGDKHTATVVFSSEGKYTWEVGYTNDAGLVNSQPTMEGEAVWEFVIDKSLPTGQLDIDGDKWDSLPTGNIIFDHQKDHNVGVTATGEDELSGEVGITYYKADATQLSTNHFNKEELDAKYQEGKFIETIGNMGEGAFVVYARFVDKAGNVAYIGTDGIIVENNNSGIGINIKVPSAHSIHGYYNADFEIGVEVTDNLSGIKEIKYEIYSDGQRTKEDSLFTFNIQRPTYSQLVRAKEGNISIVAAENNSDEVEVKVSVTSNSGLVKEATQKIKINCTHPTVSVTSQDDLATEGQAGYYNEARTATVTIIDRVDTFDQVAATDAIMGAIKCNGNTVTEESCSIVWEEESQQVPNVHKANITFFKEGKYEWSVEDLEYINRAAMSNEGMTVEDETLKFFTVDTTAPAAKIDASGKLWESWLEKITFGYWKSTTIEVSADSSTDSGSGIQKILYYKTDGSQYLTTADLEQIFQQGDFKENRITVSDDEKFVVYARVTDNAGNTSYISTDGIVFDDTESTIQLVLPDANENGYYNNDVTVEVAVNEIVVQDKAYSGIKTIDYTIENKDTAGGDVVTTGNLYTFGVSEPQYEDLASYWDGAFTVDSERHNADEVKITVVAVDNAGNRYETSRSIAINTDVLKAGIAFNDDAVNIVGEKGYFSAARMATITVVDRATSFDEVTATAGIKVKGKDYNGNNIELTDGNGIEISPWSHSGDKHMATVTFEASANYTWSFEYTNLAGNILSTENISTGQSVTPFNFVVDENTPTGTVAVADNIWDKLLSALTFGLYSNEKVDVTATSADITSPTVIEYYKTDNTTALSAEELDAKEFAPFNGLTVDKDERFVVYLKISDYAGNYTYISSDGYILDTKESSITLTPDDTAKEENYNGDVEIEVSIEDAAPYSGINTVDYWVEKDGQRSQYGNLFTFGETSPTHSQLKSSFEGKFTVEAEKNNSSNVVVFVKTVDNAGNEQTKTVQLDIDITKPTIELTYDNNQDNDGNTYFDEERTATVVITERSNHFNSDKATEGITITATDAKGNPVERAYTIGRWETVNGNTPDGDTHTATIIFAEDANYEMGIEYTDEAGNVSTAVDTKTSVAPFDFTVDTCSPTGVIEAVSAEGDNLQWNGLLTESTFGFTSKERIQVKATTDDVTSMPMAYVEYYKVVATEGKDLTKPLTSAELDNVSINQWKPFEQLTISDDEQFIVYLKITDLAGNYSYICTDGLIVDKNLPKIETSLPQPVNGLYNDDVKVEIKVTDPLTGGTYSGINNISYKVLNMGEETQKGILYEFDNVAPSQKDLVALWNGGITIDSKLNNSNDVIIVLYAEDNANNTLEIQKAIKVDITEPTIDVSYSNNDVDSSEYFKEERTATITVTERNFDSDGVKITITNTEGKIPAVSSWRQIAGTGNLDNTTWIATISYQADGDYTFDIDYADLAENRCKPVNYADSTAPTAFTIDKTLPTVSVSYDNNSARNTNYYAAPRTATVTITEHNLQPNGVDSDRVNIIMTATDDGANTTMPSVSSWSTSGDTHTATIYYRGDARYSFDVKITDKAGNVYDSFNEQVFYVDKTTPVIKITGVEDNSANGGTVTPIVTFTDTNYDPDALEIVLTGANNGRVSPQGGYANIHNGRVFNFSNFANEKQMDDIYTLKATMTDKAGNTVSEDISFSVNRFGSIYSVSEDIDLLKGTYIKEPVDVAITETNANQIENIKVVLFKNNETIELENGRDYILGISGGNGSWYRYTYTILKKNFADDGLYSISLYSEDAAGNISENNLDTKNAGVNFGVDKTAPNILITDLESGEAYDVEKKTVTMSLTDNLLLTSAVVYLDDYNKPYKTWEAEELAEIISKSGEFTFEIAGGSNKSHKVKVVCTDAAGNVTTEEIKNFYVTTNRFIVFYSNKPLFWGTVAGVTLITASGIFLFLKKRKSRGNK